MDNTAIDQMKEAIRLGERTRIIFDILLSELGMTFENSDSNKIFTRLKEIQTSYEEAIINAALIIKTRHE